MPKTGETYYRFNGGGAQTDAEALAAWVDGHLGWPDSVTTTHARVEEHPRASQYAYPATATVAALIATHGEPDMLPSQPPSVLPSPWFFTIAEEEEILGLGPTAARASRMGGSMSPSPASASRGRGS